MLQVKNSAHTRQNLSWSYTHPRRFWNVFHWGEWYSLGESSSWPDCSVEICLSTESHLNSSPVVEEAGRENSSMGGTSLDWFWFRVRFRDKCWYWLCWSWYWLLNLFQRSRAVCLLRKIHLLLRRLRLIWSRLLLVSQRLSYPWR